MTKLSGHVFWTLVRLRYKLIWAQARSSPGRVVLLIFVTLFFLSLAVLFGIVGLGAAVAGVGLGRTEVITRGVLSGFHASAVLTSLFFGLGPRAAFSESVLRRFPLTSRQRVFIRHLIGLIDPIWLILASAAFGIAIGLAIMGAGSVLGGIAAAFLFVTAAYLTAVLALSIIDRLMQTPAGSSALALIGLGALSFSSLGLSWLANPEHHERLAVVDRFLYFAPSGLAAEVMAGGAFWAKLYALALLLMWSLVLLTCVRWLEQRRTSHGSSSVISSGTHDFDTFYDRVARLFGPAYAPLVGKALRYYLRSNRVRLGLASTPIFAFLGRLMSQTSDLGNSQFYFTLAIFAFLGFSGPSSLALNSFGSDGNGARRYALLPVRFALPVRAGSVTSILLGLAVLAPSIWLWTFVTSMQLDWRAVAMVVGSSVGGLFLFNGLAMWTTLLSPKAADFTSMLNNRLPAGANLVVGVGMVCIFGIHLLLMRLPLDTVLPYWWLSVAFTAFGLVFYLACWWGIGSIAEKRRRRVIDAVAGE